MEVIAKPSNQFVAEYSRDVDLLFSTAPFIHDAYKLYRSERAFGEGTSLWL